MTKRNLPPEQVRGIKVGDLVLTPLHRIAKVIKLRVDGYIDARYEDAHSPALAEVILNADTLKRIKL